MKIKTLPLLLALLLFAVALTGCGSSGNTITGTVAIITADGTALLDKTVTVPADGATAATAVLAACQEEKMAYTLLAGMFDGFDGIESTDSDGWLLYVGEALSDVGAESTPVSDGFEISFRYVNYTEAFGN